MNDERITYFAETDARNKRVKFGIKGKDRTRHLYVIGKTGMGKSTLLENMAVQDIQNGDGMCFIDPHGKTADLLMEYIPKERMRDVVWVAPFDIEHPISFNVLESVSPEKRHLVVSGLMSTFKKIWVDAWSARMEYILTNTLLALLEYPGATLLGVNRMLSDKVYRNEVVSKVTDPGVKTFWTKEFASYTERMAAEAVPAIQNKVGQFTANPLIRNMIGQSRSSFDFREAMDRRKIVIINLSKGKIGDENMKLLGGLLVTKIYLAAMSRADLPDRTLKMAPNFYMFVDEFQNFANASFADILSESRKYKLNLTIAHQYIEQMDEEVRAAVFGNVGTMIVFRVGATDAEVLEKEFAPQFTAEDLVNLGFAQIYLKLMIDGLTSPPFSAVTIAPIPHPESSFVNEIIAASREQFARPRAEVEQEIIRFHDPLPPRSPTAGTGNGAPAASAASSSLRPSPVPPRTPSALVGMPPPARPAPSPAPSVPQRPPLEGGSPSLKEALDKLKSVPAPVQTPKPQPPSQNQSKAQPQTQAAPQTSPRQSPPSSPQPAPQPQAPAVKPVSLSSLAPNRTTPQPQPQTQPPKPDPKKQDPKNVDALKNALASVLGDRAKTVTPTPTPSGPAPVPKTPPATVQPVPTPPKPTPTPPPAAPTPEVPEDVLKRVLKVD